MLSTTKYGWTWWAKHTRNYEWWSNGLVLVDSKWVDLSLSICVWEDVLVSTCQCLRFKTKSTERRIEAMLGNSISVWVHEKESMWFNGDDPIDLILRIKWMVFVDSDVPLNHIAFFIKLYQKESTECLHQDLIIIAFSREDWQCQHTAISSTPSQHCLSYPWLIEFCSRVGRLRLNLGHNTANVGWSKVNFWTIFFSKIPANILKKFTKCI